jgi:hypothetical protein
MAGLHDRATHTWERRRRRESLSIMVSLFVGLFVVDVVV